MIDAHHHLGPEPDYAPRLVETAQALGFERVCLVGLPAWKWPWATNEHVRAALRQHPGFFVGFAYVEPAFDPPEVVDRWHDAGFRGIKLIRPRRSYDDPSYLPVYERAAALGMPVLFHTGMVSRTAEDRERDVHSHRMRPVALDYVARQVPAATLIGAHLGHPWWDEAGEACRLNPNVYVDLTGPALQALSPAELRRVLWWGLDDVGAHGAGAAWEHVVFGSDVPASRVHDVLARYRRAMAALEVPAVQQQAVLGGTMERLLGLGEAHERLP
jgi:predicted TIM-barrel fold metal-dependent hydrolase